MSPVTNSGSNSGIASFSFFSPASSPGIHDSTAGQLKTEHDSAAVPMDTAGELMFQKCVALRATDVSEAQYCSRIIAIVLSRVVKSQDPAELLDIFIGAGLALGAQSMKARHLDRLLTAILETCKTSSDDQMLAMIYGLCLALGPADSTTHRKNIETVFRHIRDSYLTSTKRQLRAMIQGLCMSCIAHGTAALCTNLVVPNILSSSATLHPTQIQEMIYGVSLAHGGAEMTPDKCAELTQTILDQYEMELEMSLHVMESFWIGRLHVQKIRWQLYCMAGSWDWAARICRRPILKWF